MRKLLEFMRKINPGDSLNIGTVLNYYRYGSLLITSIFYFGGPPAAPWFLKTGVSLCLLLEAVVFTRLFKANGDKIMQKALVAIETAGLAFILIFTGGLDSPFLWYAINPILAAATLLPFYFCWSMAAAFLVLAFSLHRFRLYSLEPDLPLWPDRSNFILIFIQITLAAQLFNHLISKLSRQAEIMANQFEHIKSLYQSVEVISHSSEPKEIINLFASYSKALTKAIKVIVWSEIAMGLKTAYKSVLYAVRGPRGQLKEEIWYPHIKKLFTTVNTNWKTDVVFLPDGSGGRGALVTVPIKSNTTVYGLLSTYHYGDRDLAEREKILHFLADLCAIILEKRAMEILAEELILSDEKDRIAGEIHDKVTQNIFGLVYGLDCLLKQEQLGEEPRQRIRVMQKTAQQSLRDLRESIYNLSSLKNKRQPFLDEIKTYLYNLGQLNDVRVTFHCFEDSPALKPAARSALYRIIREATANSIRHGFCKNIDVLLDLKDEKIRLEISDDGRGFDPKAAERNDRCGLGLINMKEQARLLGTRLSVESSPGSGTRIILDTAPEQEGRSLNGREVLTCGL